MYKMCAGGRSVMYMSYCNILTDAMIKTHEDFFNKYVPLTLL